MVNEISLTEEQNVVARSIAQREFEWKANGTHEIIQRKEKRKLENRNYRGD